MFCGAATVTKVRNLMALKTFFHDQFSFRVGWEVLVLSLAYLGFLRRRWDIKSLACELIWEKYSSSKSYSTFCMLIKVSLLSSARNGDAPLNLEVKGPENEYHLRHLRIGLFDVSKFQWLIYRVALRPLFPGRVGIWKIMLVFVEGENQRTRRKTLEAGTRTNNKLLLSLVFTLSHQLKCGYRLPMESPLLNFHS